MPPTEARSDDHCIQILHLEDSAVDHELVTRTLQSQSGFKFSISRVDSLRDFEGELDHTHFDVVLADYRLPGFTAIDAWHSLAQRRQQPPFILLTGAIGEGAAVEAIKLGMSDYLLKDDVGKLGHAIRRALEMQRIRLAKERADADLAMSERRLAEFSAHLQSMIESERASIAREVHDDIGGALTAVKFDLAWLSRHCPDPATLEHVSAAMSMVMHALGASQRIMMNLRPAILDEGLPAAIEWLAGDFERRTGIRTLLRTLGDAGQFSKSVQLVAYRTAQEALTNIAKHANCELVQIELSDANAVLTLEVADNGRGITQEQLKKPSGFGIKGLMERAKTVDGWLDVSTRIGIGTSIVLSVPLKGAAADAFQEPH